jgi:4a-hydroxytetrahydrobiopterin dehydratase
MTDLADKTCKPCRGEVPALAGEQLAGLTKQIPKWQVIKEHHLTRTFEFPDFLKALAFVNQIGAVAEEQGHHPNICFTWGKVDVTIFTHKVDGLTEADCILAAKIDRLT